MKILRFWGATLAIIAAGLLSCLWFHVDGDLFGMTTDAQRLRASLAVAGVCLVLLVAKEAFAPMWKRRLDAEQQPLRPPSADRHGRHEHAHAGLLSLRDELRASHGLCWRYRLPWLMLHGDDLRVGAVAPGLKQAGVIHVADAILLHASPDGIDAKEWRRQIRKLRPRRPVDSVIHVTHADANGTELPRELASLATDLGWAAPVTFLHAVPTKGGCPEILDAIGAFPGRGLRGEELTSVLHEQLATIEGQTADVGMQLCISPARTHYLVQISAYIDQQRENIVSGWNALLRSHWLRAPLTGVMFAPVFEPSAAVPTPAPVAENERSRADAAPAVLTGVHQPSVFPTQPAALLPAWQAIACRRGFGRRVGLYWPNALAWLTTVASIAWCAWMTISFVGNQQLAREAQALANAANEARPRTAAALRAQLALQQLIGKLEYRQQHGAPWYLRGGLSRNDPLLAGLWQPYLTAAMRNVQTPIVGTIEDQLKAAGQVRADSLESQDKRSVTYDALKTYLMLGEPSRAEPVFLKRTLVSLWPRPAEMPVGERDDAGRRLAGFYADHLNAHPEWRIALNDDLVMSTRKMLVTQIGLASADDTVYQRILEQAKGKYADASLEILLAGADARGLFTASQLVPGVYTRAAWDGMIAEAIEKAASERQVTGDWVLSGTSKEGALGGIRSAQTVADSLASTDRASVLARKEVPLRAASGQGASFVAEAAIPAAAAAATAIDEKRAAEELKQRLTARYFAEYTAAWQRMLGSIRWQPAANLNGAIDQLTRLADAQTSPLIALMKAIQHQAQAGRPSQALADTLVRKAQSLVNADAQAAVAAVNPLDKPFGPLLALMGDTGTTSLAAGGKNKANANAAENIALNGVSLSRYLTAVTTMRLKLQHIASSADAQAMARSLAQAVFQGKLSELSQARDDAALTAASLGTAWAGFGDAVFAQPLEAAWETILQPAAASLNEAWRTSVAAPFNAAVSGRYPFFDTHADASFAELGRYIRPDTGLIARFIATQLAGVLTLEGDHWAPNELAPQALQFDPQFLEGMRKLSIIGAQLYVRGDAGERLEIMALPTPNVTQSELTVDGQRIVYFNQRESWTPLAWPGDGLNGHARLTWQTTNAGLRQAFDATGDWAFLRLLSNADVKPLDSTRYQLTWNVANGDPLRYVMRTQLGAGPLELLKLRGFPMPERIFIAPGGRSSVVGKAAIGRADGDRTEVPLPRSGSGRPALPPLPPEIEP